MMKIKKRNKWKCKIEIEGEDEPYFNKNNKAKSTSTI
jgi:hypothetical protein